MLNYSVTDKGRDGGSVGPRTGVQEKLEFWPMKANESIDNFH